MKFVDGDADDDESTVDAMVGVNAVRYKMAFWCPQ